MDSKPRLIPSILASFRRGVVPPGANPVDMDGQKPEPAYRRKKQKNQPEPVDSNATHEQKCKWCRFRRIFVPRRKPCDSICVPPTEPSKDTLAGDSVDQYDPEVAQRKSPSPVVDQHDPEIVQRELPSPVVDQPDSEAAQHKSPGPVNPYFPTKIPDRPEDGSYKWITPPETPAQSDGTTPASPRGRQRRPPLRKGAPFQPHGQLLLLVLTVQRERARLPDTRADASSGVAEIRPAA